jgi:hypothetical protein
VHGHFDASLVLLTTDGTLKLCGFGEPPWMIEPPATAGEDMAADLAALGRIAAAWAETPNRKPGRAKALPESLQVVLKRLNAEDEAERYASAATLLDALDQAGSDVSPNAEAWERLLRHVRDHAPAEVALRRSA